MRPHLPLFAFGALILGLSALLPALAQSVRGVEVDAIRARSEALQKDMGDFIREVSRRGQSMEAEATAVERAAAANADRAATLVTGGPSTGPFDFDQMLGDSKEVRGASAQATGPVFIAFASTSMPPESLRRMVLDVSRAGGIVVFRGFPNNDPKAFGAALARAIKREDATENVGIDPRLFRAFHIEAVPTYVVTTADVDLCEGFGCVSHVPPHDRIAGNVTAAHALRTFSEGGGPGSPAARVYLRRLEAERAGG
jgi:conjugal transfer pilus assembly protein TrbC